MLRDTSKTSYNYLHFGDQIIIKFCFEILRQGPLCKVNNMHGVFVSIIDNIIGLAPIEKNA